MIHKTLVYKYYFYYALNSFVLCTLYISICIYKLKINTYIFIKNLKKNNNTISLIFIFGVKLLKVFVKPVLK